MTDFFCFHGGNYTFDYTSNLTEKQKNSECFSPHSGQQAVDFIRQHSVSLATLSKGSPQNAIAVFAINGAPK